MKRVFALLCVLAAVEASAQVGTAPGVIVKDEGTTQGRARSIDFVGSTVSCGISGGAGTCTFTAPTVTPATLKDATYCPDVGASDAYVCSMVSAPSSYAAGMLVTLSANTANTGTASVNVNSLGVKTITRADGSTLVTGDITATSPVLLEYDGTNFRMTSQWMRGSTGTGDFVLAAAPTISGASTFTGSPVVNGNLTLTGIGSGVYMTTGGATIYGASQLTPDAPHFETGATSNSWHFLEGSDYTYDFQNPCLTGLGTAACTDPTLILHSATQATNQAMSLGHNQTQGVITANGGVLARSLTYASGSDVALTVQCSLTGNCLNIKNSAGTLVSTFTGANLLQLTGTGTTTFYPGVPGVGIEVKSGGFGSTNGLLLGESVANRPTVGAGAGGAYLQFQSGTTGILFTANNFGAFNALLSNAGNWYIGGATVATGRMEIDNNAVAQSILIARDNGTQKWYIADGGYPVYATTTPAVSNTSANSCGTSAASIAGTNETGIITVGATSGTSCTVTFAQTAPTRRQCMVTNETSGVAVTATYSSTTVSIFAGTFAASDVLAYICQVY